MWLNFCSVGLRKKNNTVYRSGTLHGQWSSGCSILFYIFLYSTIFLLLLLLGMPGLSGNLG